MVEYTSEQRDEQLCQPSNASVSKCRDSHVILMPFKADWKKGEFNQFGTVVVCFSSSDGRRQNSFPGSLTVCAAVMEGWDFP